MLAPDLGRCQAPASSVLQSPASIFLVLLHQRASPVLHVFSVTGTLQPACFSRSLYLEPGVRFNLDITTVVLSFFSCPFPSPFFLLSLPPHLLPALPSFSSCLLPALPSLLVYFLLSFPSLLVYFLLFLPFLLIYFLLFLLSVSASCSPSSCLLISIVFFVIAK